MPRTIRTTSSSLLAAVPSSIPRKLPIFTPASRRISLRLCESTNRKRQTSSRPSETRLSRSPHIGGTGSETTGVAIFDYKPLRAKTGIAHRRLKPTLGIVDPENTRTLPAAVAASSGLDVLCHAIESLTAIPYTSRPRPERPILRPAYQGSNPISDIWSMEALRMVAKYLRRAVADPSDDEARAQMMLAAAYADVGFGNAPASTSRTECRIQFRAWCAATTRRVTTQIIRWSPTEYRSS